MNAPLLHAHTLIAVVAKWPILLKCHGILQMLANSHPLTFTKFWDVFAEGMVHKYGYQPYCELFLFSLILEKIVKVFNLLLSCIQTWLSYSRQWVSIASPHGWLHTKMLLLICWYENTPVNKSIAAIQRLIRHSKISSLILNNGVFYIKAITL